MIVNTVLNEHQLVLDIVAFVSRGDFPRSRLGEKQRGKILSSWISRKMQTIAQFSIRDPDAEGSVTTVVPEEAAVLQPDSIHSGKMGTGGAPKASPGAGSLRRTPGTAGSSLRHVESVSQLLIPEEPAGEALTLQTGAAADERALLSLPLPAPSFDSRFDERERRSDDTPTNERPLQLQLNTTLDYSPIDGNLFDSPDRPTGDGLEGRRNGDEERYPASQLQHQHLQHQHLQTSPPLHVEQNAGATTGMYLNYRPASPIDVSLPGISGGGLRVANRMSGASDDWQLPRQGGGLRVANQSRRSSSSSD